MYVYTRAWQLLIDSSRAALDRATIVMDEFEGQRFRSSVRRYMKAYANSGESRELIREVLHRPPNRQSELQLADMVVGAVARSYSDKPDKDAYRAVIKSREAHVEVWPP